MRTLFRSRNIRMMLFTTVTVLQWLSAQSWIVSTAPHANRTNVPFDTSISVTFDRDMDPASFTNATVKIYGSKTGRREGLIQYSAAGRRLTVLPERPFTVGELVTMTLTKNIKSSVQASMNSSYLFSFIIKPKKQTSGNFLLTGKTKTKYMGNILRSVDMNNDGKIDLTLTANGHLSVLKNIGGGVFLTDSLDVDWQLGETALADFDSDGFQDLSAITSDGQGIKAVYIFMNQKNGKLLQDTVIRFDSAICKLVSGDFDGDGNIDLAVAHINTKNLVILKNNGLGSFIKTAQWVLPTDVTGMVAEDWNSDGYLDLAITTFAGKCVMILINNGDGSFTQKPKYTLAQDPIAISSGDIDGDNLPDIIVCYAYANPNLASVMKNLGDGSFMQTSVIPSLGFYGMSSYICDWNGDGRLDLTISYVSDSGSVEVFINDGTGNFAESSVMKFSTPYPSMTSADFSQSGSNDLAVYTSSNSGDVHFFKSRTVSQTIYTEYSSVDFQPVIPGNTKTLWLTVMNIGLTGTLNLTNVSVKDSSLTIVSFPSSIPAGSMDSIAIQYSPTKIGILIDTMTIISNDASQSILKIPVTASSGTSISGVITGTKTWSKANSPYIVTGLTVIDNGATVNVDPGVKIMVQSNALLNVDGTLNVNGSKNDTILITSTQPGIST